MYEQLDNDVAAMATRTKYFKIGPSMAAWEQKSCWDSRGAVAARGKTLRPDFGILPSNCLAIGAYVISQAKLNTHRMSS